MNSSSNWLLLRTSPTATIALFKLPLTVRHRPLTLSHIMSDVPHRADINKNAWFPGKIARVRWMDPNQDTYRIYKAFFCTALNNMSFALPATTPILLGAFVVHDNSYSGPMNVHDFRACIQSTSGTWKDCRLRPTSPYLLIMLRSQLRLLRDTWDYP